MKLRRIPAVRRGQLGGVDRLACAQRQQGWTCGEVGHVWQGTIDERDLYKCLMYLLQTTDVTESGWRLRLTEMQGNINNMMITTLYI